MDADEETNPVFAEFAFVGDQCDIVTEQNSNYAVAQAMGRVGYLLPGILELLGKKLIVTVTPNSRSLDADFYYFQVQSTEHLQNTALLPPLPLANIASTENIGRYSSFTPLPGDFA